MGYSFHQAQGNVNNQPQISPGHFNVPIISYPISAVCLSMHHLKELRYVLVPQFAELH